MSDGLWVGNRPGTDDRALIDPARLTRHGVVFGATGSGKTGLCVCLLEELALAGVPVICIDPKGDLANLALRFRGPDPSEIRPWVDEGVAKRAGLDADAWAAQEAERLAKGRTRSGVGQARVDKLVDGVEVVVHTPGSTSGVPVDVMAALAAPDSAVIDQPEALAELASGAVSALLDLLSIRADRLKDPRHIVLTRVVETAWQAGEALDLEGLILKLIDPPFEKVGVFPLEAFFKRDDRMSLAMDLNGLVASSGFATWREGEPLDFDRLLAPVDGRAPVRVFALAHLDESRRQFFAAMLLHRLVAWSRRQPGTSALRALLYIDEAFGYCPPHPARPATKEPLLQLVKQARAVGLGVLMTSQNPVDIDYAVISNAGTWWLGRLATKQDQRRVVDGLSPEESDALGTALDGLGKWQFAVRQAAKPIEVVQTRFAMSWLRGPMTLREIEQLDQSAPAPSAAAPAGGSAVAAPAPAKADDPWLSAMPPCPQKYAVRWLDPRVAHAARFAEIVGAPTQPARPDGKTIWKPALFSRVHMRFDERGGFMAERAEDRLFYPIDRTGGFTGFPGFEDGDLLDREPGPSVYAELPDNVDEDSEIAALEKRVVDALFNGETEQMFEQAKLRLKSLGGETLEDFRTRVKAAATEKADEEIAKLKDRVDRALKSLEDKHARYERDLERYNADARARVGTELVNAGEIVFGMFFGGRKKSLSTAMSKREQSSRAASRVTDTEAKITELEREIYELEVETESEIEGIRRRWANEVADITTTEVRLERNDVTVRDFGIVWIPVSADL